MVQNKIIRVDKNHPDPDIINQAAGILKTGGLVIFPAACLYGVAANALSADAVEKIFQLKQRPRNNPILVLIKNTAQLDGLVTAVPDKARILMDKFWPGGLTIVFDAADSVNPKLTAGRQNLASACPDTLWSGLWSIVLIFLSPAPAPTCPAGPDAPEQICYVPKLWKKSTWFWTQVRSKAVPDQRWLM